MKRYYISSPLAKGGVARSCLPFNNEKLIRDFTAFLNGLVLRETVLGLVEENTQKTPLFKT